MLCDVVTSCPGVSVAFLALEKLLSKWNEDFICTEGRVSVLLFWVSLAAGWWGLILPRAAETSPRCALSVYIACPAVLT